MAKHLPGQRQPKGMEHNGPVDCMETDNFFTHKVYISRPEGLVQTVIL